MKNSKCPNKKWRQLCIASFLAGAGSLCLNAALADSDSLDESAKKVGNNFGEMLKGMGQEIKKVGKSDEPEAKTKKNTGKKRSENENESDADKEKPQPKP